jgi:hypothetical protein
VRRSYETVRVIVEEAVRFSGTAPVSTTIRSQWDPGMGPGPAARSERSRVPALGTVAFQVYEGKVPYGGGQGQGIRAISPITPHSVPEGTTQARNGPSAVRVPPRKPTPVMLNERNAAEGVHVAIVEF